MSIGPGSQIGPYRIQGPLGAGGMGEVYRALDARLGREVALKILPARFASDPDRMRRFEQEARAAGALDHPNVLAIHDTGTHEGSPYVVSELLEGETVRKRVGGTPLPLRKALDYAVQIAHGLAAAHERGIVHRDLKPENLFVTRDGRVKILDFGLAKLVGSEPPGGEGARDATLTVGTEPGKLLGTVGYMSPEQVRGQSADHRSDIFAFGAILYEMLSGRRAFRGDSAVETMNSILKEDPPELSETNRNLPPELERIVRHCLEKTADERFQSARDLAFDLEALFGGSGSTAALLATPRRRRSRALAPAIAAGALLAVVAAASFLAGRSTAGRRSLAGAAPGGSEGRAAPLYTRVTFRRGVINTGRFAPDGRSIVYSARWGTDPLDVFTTTPGLPESRALGFGGSDLLGVSQRGELALSLDTRLGGAFVTTGTLARVAMTGGAPRAVLEDVWWADWSNDGSTIVVVRNVEGRCLLEMPPGTKLHETAGWISHVRVAPQGGTIAFLDHPQRGDDGGSVAVLEPGGRPRTISAGWLSLQGLAWRPDGREVWFTATKSGRGRSLWAASLSGQERPLVSAPGTLTLEDVARDGRILVAREEARMGMAGLPPGESKERDLSWLDWSLARDLSKDGRTLLFDESGEGGGATYSGYLRGTDGGPAVRLGEGAALALSPDGRWVVMQTTVQPRQLVLVPTGTGTPRPIPMGDLEVHGVSFFPDGRQLLLAANEAGKPIRAYVGPVEGGAFRALSAEVPEYRGWAISPDGGTIAMKDTGGGIQFVPIDGGEPRRLSGMDPGYAIEEWSADGRWIYVRRRGQGPLRLERMDVGTGRLEMIREIQTADTSGTTVAAALVMTPDARSYVYSYLQATSDLYLIDGVH